MHLEQVGDEQRRRLLVEVLGRLVQHEHLGIGQQRASKHEPTALAAAEPAAVLAHGGVEPVRELGEEAREPDPVEHPLQGLVVGVRGGQPQVGRQRAVEHVGVLGGQPDHAPYVVGRQVTELDAPEGGAAAVLDEADEHRDERALPGAARPHDGDPAAGREVQVDAVQDVLPCRRPSAP